MKKTMRMALLLAAALCWPTMGPAGGDAPRMSVKALEPLTRPASLFDHDAHNAKAGIEECTACHHGGKGLVRDVKDDTSGQACVECHAVRRSDGGTPLRMAYHRQCQGCHSTTVKGPLACGSCHAAVAVPAATGAAGTAKQ